MFKPVLTPAIACLAATCLTVGASAQTTAPSVSPRSGGLAGLLGSVAPNVGSVGAGNAAGLLGYCLKNKLIGSAGLLAAAPTGSAPATGSTTATTTTPTTAQSILQRLTSRQGVTTSPDYVAGQSGKVQTPGGQSVSLDGLKGQIKTRMCGLVLDRAKSFL